MDGTERVYVPRKHKPTNWGAITINKNGQHGNWTNDKFTKLSHFRVYQQHPAKARHGKYAFTVAQQNK